MVGIEILSTTLGNRQYLLMLNVQLSCIPAVPLVGIYLREMNVSTKRNVQNVHISISIIAKNTKHPKCPSTGEWVNVVLFSYNMIIHSNEKERATDTHKNLDESQKIY